MTASQDNGEEKALALFGLASGGLGTAGASARIIGQKIGSINRIFHIEFGEKQFALRVRYNEENFQYERGVFKEVFAALLFGQYGTRGAGVLETELASLWGILPGKRSGEWIPFPYGPGIHYFDFTGTAYNGPWAILEWTGDTLGALLNSAYSYRLGRLLWNIHRLKFRRAYRSLHDLHLGGTDTFSEWQTEIACRNRNTGCTVASGESLLKSLGGLCEASRAAATEFVLCHNDLHCINVTQKQNALYLVDWDNAQIAPKELDFVKLAHWSRLGADGHFEPDAAIFASFCAGYGTAAEAVLASPIFKLAELLWLFRVLEFACRLKEPAAPPFWPPRRYAALLRQRLAP